MMSDGCMFMLLTHIFLTYSFPFIQREFASLIDTDWRNCSLG